MPLALDDRKLLTPGVHDASFQEIDELFARFQKSDRRLKFVCQTPRVPGRRQEGGLWSRRYRRWQLRDGLHRWPSDIDLILVLPADWDLDAELKPYQYNLVSRRRARKAYRIDVHPVKPDSEEERDWITFFGGVNVKWCDKFSWPIGTPKGIVRVVL
jgi:hypothetical protein